MSESNGNVPQGWVASTLGKIAHIEAGQSPPSSSFTTDPSAIEFLQGNAEFGDLFPRPIKRTSEPTKFASESAVLLSVRAPVGATNLSPGRIAIGRGLMAIEPLDGMDPRFLLWLLRSKRGKLEAQATGTTFPAVTGRVVRGLPVLLPPRAEQDRIVAIIEALFAQVDDGLAEFDDAFNGAQTYERSLFAEAFGGGLAPAPLKGETSDALLNRLGVRAISRAELHTNWPGHWRAARLGDLASHITSGSRDWKPYYGRGTGVFVLTQSVRMRRLDLSNPFHVDPPADDAACSRCAIARDDLLVTIVGANVGNTARVPVDVPEHYVCQSLALIRPRERRMSRFLELYLAAPNGGQRFFDECFYGQGRPHISFADIKRMPVPVPPLEEQAAIVSSFDRKSAALDNLKVSMESARKRAEGLRQSVLHQAFTGGLSQRNKGPAVLIEEYS